MSEFQPEPFVIVDSPEQLKAFTDPLRARVLSILTKREATNQQIATALGEPHAKVLHHVRALVEMGLIRLVETRIKGGNVEKYYRAVALMFGIRPPPELLPSVADASFEALRQDVAVSAALWPETPSSWEFRRAHLSPERAEAFTQRLLELIAEYWGGPSEPVPAEEDPGAPMLGFAAVIYRTALDIAGDRAQPAGEPPADEENPRAG